MLGYTLLIMCMFFTWTIHLNFTGKHNGSFLPQQDGVPHYIRTPKAMIWPLHSLDRSPIEQVLPMETPPYNL